MTDEVYHKLGLEAKRIFVNETQYWSYKSLISADGTEYDGEIQNATTTVNWLVTDVTALSTPEWLLGFIPLGVFLPRVVKRLRKRE